MAKRRRKRFATVSYYLGNALKLNMLKIQTKLTSQGQVSVPAPVRRFLGLTPGSTLEWAQTGDGMTVRRAARSGTLEVHEALFPEGGAPASVKTLGELKQGIRQHMQRRRAGR